MTPRWHFVALCTFASLGACLWLREPDDLSAGSAGGSDATTSSSGGTASSSTSGTLGDASGSSSSGSSGVDAGTAACEGVHGPAAVRVGTSAHCIDATEVTVGDYVVFVDSDPPVSGDARCAWKTDYHPADVDLGDLGARHKPITGVDWCDAVEYCAWAGKRLCAGNDGASLESAKVYDEYGRDGEWFTACSANDTRMYPYGNDFDESQCIVDASAGPADVDGVRCEGGYPGIHDLNGNVREWTDHCAPLEDGGVSEQQVCMTLGGGPKEDQHSTYLCSNHQRAERAQRNPTVGFRCCSSWVEP